MINDAKLAPGLSEPPVTVEQLAHMGGGFIAYVKPMLSDEAQKLVPQVEAFPRACSSSPCSAPRARPFC